MVTELNLEGKTPADIDDAAPLFGAGLGLDSLDALQLAMCVEERFGVRIPEGAEARPIFASVNALVAHIVAAPKRRRQSLRTTSPMRIWVTGIGVVSPLARGAGATMDRLVAGDRAFGPLTLFHLREAAASRSPPR